MLNLVRSQDRRELRARYGIEFAQLFTITKWPIGRYLADLSENGEYKSCLRKLVDAFNPLTIDGPMCRSMMSVEWQGNVFDCDFHRMLNLKVASRGSTNILDLNDQSLDELRHCPIAGKHCFGCTAGAGSSCSGRLK